VVLLGLAGGRLEGSALSTSREALHASPLYLPALWLILIGAFTKSAQFPFHFWLPNAMEAPTPVSGYLHSATMVKAGVYLLARLHPALGGTKTWGYVVGGVGALTMLTGAFLALAQTDLKRLLAYATVSALGMLTLLIGLGTPLALKAAMVLLFAHALYKGALFLVAGAVDHETGRRDVTHLRGLLRAMPITATAAGVAALSMASLPPLFGFIWPPASSCPPASWGTSSRRPCRSGAAATSSTSSWSTSAPWTRWARSPCWASRPSACTLC
jgi:multicomponent Na+:H+ antiporter subunit A